MRKFLLFLLAISCACAQVYPTSTAQPVTESASAPFNLINSFTVPSTMTVTNNGSIVGSGTISLSGDIWLSGLPVTTQSGMVFVNLSTGSLSVAAFPPFSLTSNQGSNLGAGNYALTAMVAGFDNVAVGFDAMHTDTNGSQDTVIGAVAGLSLNNDGGNVLIGYWTGQGLVSGNYNTIIGGLVSGLSPTLTDNIILATGEGLVRAQFDSNAWTISSGITTGSLSATGATTLSGGVKVGAGTTLTELIIYTVSMASGAATITDSNLTSTSTVVGWSVAGTATTSYAVPTFAPHTGSLSMAGTSGDTRTYSVTVGIH